MAPGEIVSRISDNGVVYIPDAVRDDYIASLMTEVDENKFAINRNWVGGVYTEEQYFLTHLLACSRSFHSLVISDAVFSICDTFFGGSYRLKAMRYYETYGRFHMQWHTDNKNEQGATHIPGAIFIVYLEDVADGEFQYVLGSHLWSGCTGSPDYPDEEIAMSHADRIRSFKGKRGGLVVYNTHGVHRAKPATDKNFVRKSLFFQIDEGTENGEQMLLNSAFIQGLTEKQQYFFGIGSGQKSDYVAFPKTDERRLPKSRAKSLVKQITSRNRR